MSTASPSSTRDQPALSLQKQATLNDMGRVATFFGIALFGALAIVFLALWCKYSVCSALVGTIWSLALAAIGTFAGFLFGVPKVLQSQSGEASRTPRNNTKVESGDGAQDQGAPPSYQQRVNTNLEEISDWITKIIVGLGLVELRNAPSRIHRLSLHIAASFNQQNEVGAGLATALVLFFTVGGFLFGYLLTRLYLQGALGRADRDAVSRELDQTRVALGRASYVLAEHNPWLREKLKTLSVDSILNNFQNLWMQDPNSGGFGGAPASNNRRLSAQISSIPGAASAAICHIRLTVESTDPQAKPLRGDVVFYLHPTFVNPKRAVTVGPTGIATLEFDAAGRFTVGAEADQGETKLELDLAKVPGGTPEFYQN